MPSQLTIFHEMCEKLHRPVVPYLCWKGLTAFRAAPDIVELRLPCAVFSLLPRRTKPPDTIFIFQPTNSIRTTVAECVQKDLLLPKWPAIVVLSEMVKNELIFVFEICKTGNPANDYVLLFCWMEVFTYFIDSFQLDFVSEANFGCSFPNTNWFELNAFHANWKLNAAEHMNKAIHECALHAFDKNVYVELLWMLRLTHWSSPLCFGFVYYVYYHQVIIIIICTARIFQFLSFIFYRCNSRQSFWLQCNGLQCFYLARMSCVHHIRAAVVPCALCMSMTIISLTKIIWHNGMRVMPIKISATAPFAIFNYNASKISEYSFTDWTFVTSSWMRRRSLAVSSRYSWRQTETRRNKSRCSNVELIGGALIQWRYFSGVANILEHKILSVEIMSGRLFCRKWDLSPTRRHKDDINIILFFRMWCGACECVKCQVYGTNIC